MAHTGRAANEGSASPSREPAWRVPPTDQYGTVFRRSPVALFQEDYSDVRQWLFDRRLEGVVDMQRHLESDPARVRAAVAEIRITDANPAAAELMGVADPARLLGTPHELLVGDTSIDGWRRQILAFDAGRMQLDFEVAGATFDGEPRMFSVRWVLGAPGVLGSDDHLVVVAITDVTPLHRRAAEATDLMQARTHLLEIIAHELNTPLAAIIGFSEELMTSWDSFTGSHRSELVEIINDQAHGLGLLVEDLLTLSGYERRRIEITAGRLYLDEIVRATLAEVELRPDQTLSLNLEVVPAIGDHTRVRQAVRNLLENAARYGGKDVRVRTAFDAGYSRVVVCDDGPGIAGESVERAFEPHVSLAAGSSPGNLGIGLAVGRVVATLMGGSLTYERAGDRSVFALALPIEVPATA